MNDETPGQAEQAANGNAGNQLDPGFFACVNEYLELTNRHSREQGLKRISMASMFAAARFNAHVFLAQAGADTAAERQGFLDYMTTLYRRMLNQHLDGLGHERGIDVGESELAAEYAAPGGPLAPAAPATE